MRTSFQFTFPAKFIVLFLFSSLLFSACTPKIITKISNSHPPLANNAYVVVLQKEDSFVNNGIELGTIKIGEKGFTKNCSYNEMIFLLKQLARDKGANLIKIIEQKNPDNWSTCVRLTANIYNVPDYSLYEKEIEWSPDRKLTWKDFKGEPKLDSALAAGSALRFSYELYQVNIFQKPKLFTKSIFDSQLSWVRPDQLYRTDLLEHEQTHFDICELYIRHLRKRFEENKLTSKKIRKDFNTLFNEIYSLYLERQDQYDRETNYSQDSEKQIEWSKKIKDELAAYSQ